MFDNLREDLRRYGDRPAQQLASALVSPGAWATVGYRWCRWVHTTPMPVAVGLPLKVVAAAVQAAVNITTNIQLSNTAVIGPGLFIAHTGYIVLASGTVIGKHCTLTQGVTIGHAGGGGKSLAAAPVIGDRVYVGPGAAVIGDITVGNDALIGISAVVTRSLPARAVAVGNPARILSSRGAFEVNPYPGMNEDPERVASIVAAQAAAAVPVAAKPDPRTL